MLLGTIADGQTKGVNERSFVLACVAWRFWFLSNKGGRGQKNREEIGAGATELSASPLVLARLAREFRGFAARAPGSTKNRHATQATFVFVHQHGSDDVTGKPSTLRTRPLKRMGCND